MSRVSETYKAIEGTKTALYGSVEKPILYLIPLLTQMALSLATIADSMKGVGDERSR